jgi:hypothetical protein
MADSEDALRRFKNCINTSGLEGIDVELLMYASENVKKWKHTAI